MSRKQRPSLSPAEKQRILELYNSGLTGYEVAEVMGIGNTTVYKHLPRQGKPWKRWTEEEMQAVIKGYARGLPVREIAKKVGHSSRAVMIKMCRHRKLIRADPHKQKVMKWINYAIGKGLKPGQALSAIRRADLLGRECHDLQF